MKTEKSRKIEIGETLPILTERENEIIESWRRFGNFNRQLYDKIRIIKSKNQ